MSLRQRIALLGSTGSIGTQTLDVVRRWPQRLEVSVITARENWQMLATQAREFLPDAVAITNKAHYAHLRDALADLPVKVYAGDDAVRQLAAAGSSDVVVNAIVGYAGLEPTLAAVEAGKKVALANKESLVVAGTLLMELSARHRAPIIPIDSEHSAVLQCLTGESGEVRRLILTASGGPFRDTPAEALEHVTPHEALRHPTWQMGAKISIDSATLLNKGLEVIEAHHLFGIEPERIEVLIHPQSVVHSMVEFADGSVKAQMGQPDMRLPIQYALSFPRRWENPCEKFNFVGSGSPLTFHEPDHTRFPALGMAYEALRRGGNAGAVLNAANEVAVSAFLDGCIGFTTIPRVIEHTMERVAFVPAPTIETLRESNSEAAKVAHAFISKTLKIQK